jgi:hypothetical protein
MVRNGRVSFRGKAQRQAIREGQSNGSKLGRESRVVNFRVEGKAEKGSCYWKQ